MELIEQDAFAEDHALAPGAGLPRRLFHCRLDDQPDHLVPQHNLRDWAREDLSDRPLFINPDCRFSRNDELPPLLTHRHWLLDNFALGQEVILIKDPVRQALLPFWLGPAFRSALAGLRPGDRVSSSTPHEARQVLAMASVLVAGNHHASVAARWRETISRSATGFAEKHYSPVAHLIHPFHISALRRYYRHLIRTGQIPLGDSQSPRRYWVQNEPVSRFFHHQLTATVGRVVQEAVKPSYVYFASYQSGADLEAHTDREQCEFSVSLCLDFSPEPVRETPWPLALHTPTGKTQVFQGIGDALIYCGRELPHSRAPLPPGNTSTSLFFHFVRESFTGQLT